MKGTITLPKGMSMAEYSALNRWIRQKWIPVAPTSSGVRRDFGGITERTLQACRGLNMVYRFVTDATRRDNDCMTDADLVTKLSEGGELRIGPLSVRLKED